MTLQSFLRSTPVRVLGTLTLLAEAAAAIHRGERLLGAALLGVAGLSWTFPALGIASEVGYQLLKRV